MLISVLYRLASVASVVMASDQINDSCRRFEHRTTVVNNKLYIDGGKWNTYPVVGASLNESQTARGLENLTNTELLYSDLLVITPNMGMPVMQYAPSKKAQVPSVSGGALWADEINGRFYAFGGYHVNGTPPTFQTWSYDTSRNTWDDVITTGDTVAYVAHGMSAIAPDAGTAFYLGGYHDSTTNQGWTGSKSYTPNLVEFDLVNRRYTNHSGPDSDGRGEGLMVFIPASNTGLLVYFGGVIQSANDATAATMSMDSIWIYDISLQKWYQQRATGDVPESRSRFCGTVAWPDDRSSFNIYIYGGLAQNGTAFDDLYLLSLPSFIWLKLYRGSDEGGTLENGHHSMTCDIINGTQMIVMGGTFPKTDRCDSPPSQSQHSVDMGSILIPGKLWNKFNLDNPPYRVPDVLVNVIGGTTKGGANVSEPKSNRTHDQYLFEKEYKVPQRYPTPVNSASVTAVASPSVAATTKSDGLSRGTLIGAIVGSIAGGVLVGLGVFYLIYDLRRRARSQEKGKTDVSQAKDLGNKQVVDNVILGELQGRKILPGELSGNQVNEMGNVRANEMENHPLVEMWAEPTELEDLVVSTREDL